MSIKKRVLKNLRRDLLQVVARVIVYVTLTGPLRIQSWSQDRRIQTKPNREQGRKKAGEADGRVRTRKVARKGHRLQKGHIRDEQNKEQKHRQKQKKQTGDNHINKDTPRVRKRPSSSDYTKKASCEKRRQPRQEKEVLHRKSLERREQNT